MKPMRIFLIITLFFTAVAAGSSRVTAQLDGTTFTSEKTGRVIDIGDSGEASFDLDYSYTDESLGFYQENIAIEHGTSLFYISFTSEKLPPQEWMENGHALVAPDYQVYQVLDEQIESVSSSSLRRVFTRLQFTESVYSEYQLQGLDSDPISLTLYSAETALIDDLHWAVDNLTVDGEPVLMKTDYSYLQPFLDGTSGVEPRTVTEYISDVSDWEDEGLISETGWVSPQFGTTISWDDKLNVMFPKRNALSVQDGVLDGIWLTTPDLRGEVAVSVVQPTEDRSTPQHWIDRWTSEEFLDIDGGAQSFTVLDSEVSDSTASVVILATTWQGEEFIVIFDAYVAGDGSMIVRRTNATRENIAEIMTITWSTVKANDKPIPHSWTIEEIEVIGRD